MSYNAIEEHRDAEGHLHKDDGPALVQDIGKGIESTWYKHGKKHRVGGPAVDGPNYTEYWIDGRLHRDGGPSVVYHVGDEQGNGVGQKLWHLNGVLVPQHIAEATDADFDRDWFFKERNAEVKREIVRKFGAERIFNMVDKPKSKLRVGEAITLDQEGDYELIWGKLTSNVSGAYLKMKNPSIGTWHLEGVAPECKTVEDAIQWRNGGLIGRPDKLT